jgi:N-acetyl-gamma-glutamylphosphate reductase
MAMGTPGGDRRTRVGLAGAMGVGGLELAMGTAQAEDIRLLAAFSRFRPGQRLENGFNDMREEFLLYALVSQKINVILRKQDYHEAHFQYLFHIPGGWFV